MTNPVTTIWIPTNFTCSISPSVTNNLYDGDFTLSIRNVTIGTPVLIQRYLDVNSDGIVDDGDLLVQSFTATASLALSPYTIIGSLNNPAPIIPVQNPNILGSNVTWAPGGMDVTFKANENGLFRNFIGQYIFTVQAGGTTHSATAVCTVTNSAPGTVFTGNVVCDGTNVPYAGVLLYFTTDGVEAGPMLGSMADSNGQYSIPVPPGLLWPTKFVAFKSNYVGVARGLGPIPQIVSTNGPFPIYTDLEMQPAIANISGPIPGLTTTNGTSSPIIIFGTSSNGLSAIGFSDTNGNFNLPVTQAQWKISVGGLMSASYLGLLSDHHGMVVDTSTNPSVTTNLTVFTGDSVIYGRVMDTNGNSMAGVFVSAKDTNNLFDLGTYTDENGYFYFSVLSSNAWNVFVTDYEQVFHWGDTNVFTRNGAITLMPGSSREASLLGMPAPYQISGSVQDGNSNSIQGAGVVATFAGSPNYSAYCRTGWSGHYILNVAAGNWNVSVNCDSNRNDGLQHLGYQCVNEELVKIVNANGTADFVTPLPGFVEFSGAVFDPNYDPVTNLTVRMFSGAGSPDTLVLAQVTQTDANGSYRFFLTNGDWTVNPDATELAALGLDGTGEYGRGTVASFNVPGIVFLPPYLPPPMPFFTGQVPLGSYAYYLHDSTNQSFGYYSQQYFPWVYHYDLGFEYFFDANNAAHGAYLYDLTSGHIWYTEPGLFPFLYDFELKTWLYCYPDTSAPGRYLHNPRLFYNFNSRKIWSD